jgi:hypothetical protein
MNGPLQAFLRWPAGRVRAAVICAALCIAPWAARAAPADDGSAIPCTTGSTDRLAGSQAGPGTRFGVAIGMTVGTPSRPVNGWTLARCNSEQVFFTRSDPVGKDFMTAVASHIGLSAWTDEPAFEDQVRRTLDQNQPPGQHLKTVLFEPTTIDGRPCVDVLRVGTVEPMRGADGATTPPTFTRERLRACHLRDARGPEAAVMVMFKEIALHDPLRFDDTALPFLAGVKLPSWTQPASASDR